MEILFFGFQKAFFARRKCNQTGTKYLNKSWNIDSHTNDTLEAQK